MLTRSTTSRLRSRRLSNDELFLLNILIAPFLELSIIISIGKSKVNVEVPEVSKETEASKV